MNPFSVQQLVVQYMHPEINSNKCMNFYTRKLYGRMACMLQILRVMKLIIFFLTTAILQVSASGFAQRVTINLNKAPLTAVFKEIRKQTGYDFFYSDQAMKKAAKVNINVKDVDLKTVMEMCMADQQLSYRIEDKIIMVKEKITVDQLMRSTVQPRIYIGVVHDEHDQPLTGVGIKIKGTDLTTSTNLEGRFTTPVITDPQAVLIFSYVGYVTEEVNVAELKAPIIIKLKVANSDLDQVQITAYGSTTKRLNTGNTFTITSAEIAKNPVPNVLQVMQYRVPGLSITQNTGQVGGSFLVRVRGINGLNNIDPLYIVDGVPFPAGGLNNNPNGMSGGLPTLSNNRGSGTLAQQGGNALNYINPSDIESIDILKDADATSIYGSRGAYGVILITTKKGKQGKPRLNVSLNRGIAEPGTFPELLKTEDYLMLRREALSNDGLNVAATDVDLNGTYPEDAYTNWSRELTGHTANTTRLNTTYSGGTDLTSFSLSGSYNDHGNVLQAKGYNRDGSLRFQINNTTVDKKFGIDLSGYYSSTVNTMVPYDFTGDASIFRAPNAPSYFLPDGSLNWESGANPYAYINAIYKGLTNNLFGGSTLYYRPLKGLTLKAVLGYNLLTGNELRAIPSTVFNPAGTNNGQNTNSANNAYNIRTWSFEPFVNYTTQIAKGTLSITAGATLQDKLNNQATITGTGFVADARLNNPSAGTTLTQNYNQFVFRYEGYFGSVNYNWDNKYLLNAVARYDGSTRFGPGHRYGLFGSMGLGYIFTEEKWIKDQLPFLSFGKLRASYGTSGGDGIPNYLYLSTYTTTTAYLGNTAFLNNGLANADLHWETTYKRDIGLTLGFFKDRLTLDAGYYKNTTTESLVQQPLASTTGFISIAQNSPAETQSTGIELTLTTANVRSKNFSWTTNAVMTIPETKLVSFPAGQVLTVSNYIVGKSLTNVKVYDYVGVNPETGVYNFNNAAGVQGPYITGLTEADKTRNVDVASKYFGSISNTLVYKSFSLDFTFSLVNKVGFNYQGRLSSLPGMLNQNSTTWALDRWRQPGDVTNVPKATTSFLNSFLGQNTFRQSSGAYERIIFSRLQNVSIAYDLSNSFFKRINVNNMRIVASGQNLLTFSKYHDLDPENNSLNSMPPLRILNLGLNFTL